MLCMAEKTSIIVYSKKGCSYCDEVKTYLTQVNKQFVEIDITYFDQYREVLQAKYGIRHVPVVEIGSQNSYTAVTDVGINHLVKALKKLKQGTA